MSFWQYFWYFGGRAFDTPWQIAAYVTGALAIILGILVWRKPQWEPTKRLLLWVVPLALFVLITPISWVTTSYNIYKEAQKPEIDMELITKAFEKLGESLKDGTQSNTDATSINEAIGIIETVTGQPAYLLLIEDASKLGDVSQYALQTFTGLYVIQSPIFMSIPKFGYSVIIINSIDDDTFEATFLTYIIETSDAPFTLTVAIESQTVLSQSIPVGSIGLFKQSSEAPINKAGGIAFEDRDLLIQVEAGVVQK
jgi:hypothetical protein